MRTIHSRQLSSCLSNEARASDAVIALDTDLSGSVDERNDQKDHDLQ